MKAKAVLFDLDGTLLDTATDLGYALNCVLEKRNLSPIPLDQLRASAGKGSSGLLKAALNIDDSHPEFSLLSEELLHFYDRHALRTTQLFNEMDVVLEFLTTHTIPWGIVTNKPHRFTVKILEGLNLMDKTPCVISGDSLPKAKPHPEPILAACDLLTIPPSECLYVGDSEIDMIASRAAGTFSILARYGYIEPHETPDQWDVDGIIHQPLELLKWIS